MPAMPAPITIRSYGSAICCSASSEVGFGLFDGGGDPEVALQDAVDWAPVRDDGERGSLFGGEVARELDSPFDKVDLAR